jgi:transcription elongation factor SPT5
LSSQVGQESHIVRSCLVASPQEERPQILAAFEVSSFIPGSVYIEARDSGAVSTAIRGLNGVPRSPRIDFVPPEDRPALLNCHTISKVAKWVRVRCGGKHHGDLAYVKAVDQANSEATVLLVPRLSSDGEKSRAGKRTRQRRPDPCIFDPRLSGLLFDQLEDGGVVFRGQTYRGGLVEMIFPDHKLSLGTPTAEELEVFDRAQGLEASVMAKAWSYHSAKALTPECRVRLVSGEQSGLTGRVLSITDNICQFLSESTPTTNLDVRFSDLRLHFRVGDYVRVKAGRFVGSVGWVTQVEERADTDLVTFIDEGSATNKEPNEVRISYSLLKYI